MRRALQTGAMWCLGSLVALPAVAPATADGGLWPVPRVAIYPGDEIAADHLVERAYLAVGQPEALARDRAQLIGKVARRTLLPGQPIPLTSLRERYVVKQGTAARIVYSDQGLTITGVGIPLRSASVGDAIEVRNPETGIVVRGRVAEDGSVSVDAR